MGDIGDSEGQLGLDNYSYDLFYTKPRFIRYQINVTNIGCGYEHTIIRSEMGNIYAMGSNKFGQIGLVRLRKRRKQIRKNFEIVFHFD